MAERAPPRVMVLHIDGAAGGGRRGVAVGVQIDAGREGVQPQHVGYRHE